MADINPFRYRGYYYDAETGFYYLQTRYYDPSVRMFINADNYELVSVLSQTVGQLNMYAYANNNPVMFTDDNGEGVWLFILYLAVFTLSGAGIGLGIGTLSGHEGRQLAGDVALGAIAGLFAGSLTASLWGVFGVLKGYSEILGILPIRTWALGAAIYDLLGFVVAPILGIDFQPIEAKDNIKYEPVNLPPAIITPHNSYVVGGQNG